MGVIWIVVGVGIACALARGIIRARKPGSEAHLGFVSHRWIAEHRLSLLPDRQR
jgi:hypothetical protein